MINENFGLGIQKEFDEVPVVPEKIDYKSKDTLLYNKWAETKSKKDLTNLINHLSPLLYKEVSRASGTLPVAALNAEAKNWAIKGIKTFDPSRGFAIGTHVTNYIQRVRRMNYKYQHVARLPEDMKTDYPEWNLINSQLTDELNREPTEEELAHRLGWSKGKVIRFKTRVYSDLIEGGDDTPVEVDQYSDQPMLMRQLLSRLTPEESFIINNKGKLSTTELANKLGVNTNRFNYLHKKLISKVKDLKTELGMM
jgi:DNA-directed RNA polymerase specialized sigma subunit